MNATIARQAANPRAWIKRFGAIGFAFFFIKGLLWMAAPLVFYHMM